MYLLFLGGKTLTKCRKSNSEQNKIGIDFTLSWIIEGFTVISNKEAKSEWLSTHTSKSDVFAYNPIIIINF